MRHTHLCTLCWTTTITPKRKFSRVTIQLKHKTSSKTSNSTVKVHDVLINHVPRKGIFACPESAFPFEVSYWGYKKWVMRLLIATASSTQRALASAMRKDPNFQLQVLNPTLKCLKGETCIARGNNLPFYLSWIIGLKTLLKSSVQNSVLKYDISLGHF